LVDVLRVESQVSSRLYLTFTTGHKPSNLFLNPRRHRRLDTRATRHQLAGYMCADVGTGRGSAILLAQPRSRLLADSSPSDEFEPRTGLEIQNVRPLRPRMRRTHDLVGVNCWFALQGEYYQLHGIRQARLSTGGGIIQEMELLSGLAGLKTASDLTTLVRERLGSRDVKLDEVVARIIEIQGLISDGRTALIDVQEQLLEKNREISNLEQMCTKLTDQLAKRSKGRVHDSAVWKVLEDGTEEGPYCPNCFETKMIFIQARPGVANDEWALFHCIEHGTSTFSFRVPTRLCGDAVVKNRASPPRQAVRSPWS